MRAEDIRELLRRVPFRPFRLYLTNNHIHEIRHPELIAVSRSTVLLGLPGGGPGPPTERVMGIALIHIVEFELLPPAVAASTN